ncbi:UNVERIFIED_CONTAM: hypothetical protein Sradi_1750300 [Sesamum radiatum]|uniref:Uncharacterized protein n=1 Tax=Sesamum radiatum TaxID=300843 RepID=A0AAW2TU09_SESRA
MGLYIENTDTDGNTKGVQQAKEIQDPLHNNLTIGSGPMTRGRLKRMQEAVQAQSNKVFANMRIIGANSSKYPCGGSICEALTLHAYSHTTKESLGDIKGQFGCVLGL